MKHCAEVVKLVDTHGSGPCGGNPVEVRVLSSAPLALVAMYSQRTLSFLICSKVFLNQKRSFRDFWELENC